MAKPHAKSTLKEMKDYIRANKLNKPDVRLGMKKAEIVAALKKMGHWDPKHDGASGKTSKEDFAKARQQLKKAISKPTPKPAPKKKGPVQGEDPAKDKRLYDRYVKELKSRPDITKKQLDNLENMPDGYRNDIFKKAMRDVYKEQQKSKPKPAPKQQKSKPAPKQEKPKQGINDTLVELSKKRQPLVLSVMDVGMAKFRTEVVPKIKRIDSQMLQLVKRKLEMMGMKFNDKENKNLELFMSKVKGNSLPKTSKGFDKMAKDFFDMAKKGFAIREPTFDRYD